VGTGHGVSARATGIGRSGGPLGSVTLEDGRLVPFWGWTKDYGLTGRFVPPGEYSGEAVAEIGSLVLMNTYPTPQGGTRSAWFVDMVGGESWRFGAADGTPTVLAMNENGSDVVGRVDTDSGSYPAVWSTSTRQPMAQRLATGGRAHGEARAVSGALVVGWAGSDDGPVAEGSGHAALAWVGPEWSDPIELGPGQGAAVKSGVVGGCVPVGDHGEAARWANYLAEPEQLGGLGGASTVLAMAHDRTGVGRAVDDNGASRAAVWPGP
jgi:hypothetical protein